MTIPRFPLAFALALGAVLPAASPVAAQTDRPELLDVRFEGNVAFPADSLRRAIVNRSTECRIAFLCAFGIDLKNRNYLQPRELARDALRLQVYYLERGYREAQVDTAVSDVGDGVAVTFAIDEGRPVTVDSVEVFTLDELPDSSVIRNLPLRTGDPLSAILLEATRDTLQNRLRNRGFAFADVLVNYEVPRGGYAASVLFDVATGPRTRFGPLSIEGNVELDTTVVRRMLPFRPGEIYQAAEIVEAQRNLFGLEIVQSARVQPVLTEGDTIVPIRVTLSEGQVHRVRGGVGWSTAECFSTEARWASRNFLGGARRLTIRARVANLGADRLSSTACTQVGSGDFADWTGQFAVELFQPFVGSSRNSLVASAFLERQSVPDVFIRRAIGVDFAFSRDLGRRLTMTLGWQPALTELTAADLFFCAAFAACLPADIEIFSGANWLSPLTANFTQDTRNSLLNPSRGWAWILDVEHARAYTGSDFGYTRFLGELSGYRERGNVVLAGRIGGGIVERGSFSDIGDDRLRVVHPQKRFYSGGASSVRGFAENRLGPRVLTTDVENLLGYATPDAAGPVCTPAGIRTGVCDPSPLPDDAFFPQPVGGTVMLEANAEVRVPLAAALQGVGFVDVGQVWSDRSEVQLGDLQATPGVGVRYMSPIGPIRVDLAYRFQGAERLSVATRGVRPYVEGEDDAGNRVEVPWAGGETRVLDFVRTDDVAFLLLGDEYGASRRFLSRLQLHISIGQAF